jgi:hypothetical protein
MAGWLVTYFVIKSRLVDSEMHNKTRLSLHSPLAVLVMFMTCETFVLSPCLMKREQSAHRAEQMNHRKSIVNNDKYLYLR